MKICQLLHQNIQKLKDNNIETAEIDAQLLLAFVINKNREYILTYPEKTISKSKINNYNKLINKRIKNYSVASLIGKKDFYGIEFTVNKNVLIPRPETELMVGDILKLTDKFQKFFLIDLGTGSSCIITSILLNIQKQQKDISNSQFFAIDISKKALNIAMINAKKHKINNLINFYKGNLLSPIINLIKKNELVLDKKIIITANLPYLTPTQVKNSPSIKKEPQKALIAGNDGLKYYNKLFKQINQLTINQPIWIYCEIDPSQTKNFTRLAEKELKDFNIQVKKDYSKLDRFMVLSRKN